MNSKKLIIASVLLILCLSTSGCALIALPFKVVGKILDIVSSLPKPPPGVIPGIPF